MHFPFFTFCIIVFAIWVVMLHFVEVFAYFALFFCYFWLSLMFLWLCCLSSIIALWWDCVALENMGSVASSHWHSLFMLTWAYDFVVFCVLVLCYIYVVNYLLKYVVWFSYIELVLFSRLRFNTKIMYCLRILLLKKLFFFI